MIPAELGASGDAAAANAKATVVLVTLLDDARSMSLVGFSAVHMLGLSRAELASHGQGLSARRCAAGIEIRKVRSEVGGAVNAYPVEMIGKGLGVSTAN